MPDEHVLLSDFDGWHPMSNGAFIIAALSEHTKSIRYAEDEELDRMFDFMSPYDDAERSTQATMWELRREWVKKAAFFQVR